MEGVSFMRGKVQLKHTEDYYLKVLLTETTVGEIMTSPAVTVRVDRSFKDIPKLFAQHHIRHLPVVDDQSRLVGLLSQRDLYRIQPPKKTLEGDLVYDEGLLENVILSNVMVRDPFCMNETESMGDALAVIVEKKYGCIPVVDEDGVVKGILTQVDILKVAAQIYLE